ncbi:cyclomaltodextrinase C-terminal domain-containing protein [Lewinella sp. JB7]|uniref:cyclomaltodextrinase C-terminal domain-containing protein n=1 Tax=Lewinella sp. JB7 TaxID=2962887 RepID=UPI0020C9EC14|nr:cyclomaltodextrinase C-terminal domain-containing protein [Lewinella sp. JB7]MCP9234981.1 cyclomaltodextrinase C-terminal domain-containing protein [Lewinella sp. JB7]
MFGHSVPGRYAEDGQRVLVAINKNSGAVVLSPDRYAELIAKATRAQGIDGHSRSIADGLPLPVRSATV